MQTLLPPLSQFGYHPDAFLITPVSLYPIDNYGQLFSYGAAAAGDDDDDAVVTLGFRFSPSPVLLEKKYWPGERHRLPPKQKKEVVKLDQSETRWW